MTLPPVMLATISDTEGVSITQMCDRVKDAVGVTVSRRAMRRVLTRFVHRGILKSHSHGDRTGGRRLYYFPLAGFK